MNIYIRPDGTVQFLYDEKIPAAALGKPDIRRASHVEPAPLDTGKWIADLAPVGGPYLGPFDTRTEALNAEAGWLDAQLALGPVRVVGAPGE